MRPKWVQVKVCSNPLEASFLQSYLAEHDLFSRFDNEDSMRWTGRYSTLGYGVRLYVLPQDEAQARALLDNPPTFASDSCDDENAYDSSPECPQCTSSNLNAVQSGGWSWVLVNILLLGMPYLFRPTHWVCQDCGHDWRE